jgi:hypothetical protein
LYVNKEFGYYETTKIKMIDSIYLDSGTKISKSSTRDKRLKNESHDFDEVKEFNEGDEVLIKKIGN